MKRFWKPAFCLLLLLALCACNYESGLKGTWQGDGGLVSGVEDPEALPPFEGAGRWTFDGEDAAVATVDGRKLQFSYCATDDTLTLTGGGTESWGIPYERKGDTLRIGETEFTRVK